MTLAAQMLDDVADVFLNTDDFAEAVTRYPLGQTSSGASAVGVFAEDQPDQALTAGEHVNRKASIVVASSVAPDNRDSWLIRSEVWQTAGIESATAGMILVRLSRTDRISSRGNGGINLL